MILKSLFYIFNQKTIFLDELDDYNYIVKIKNSFSTFSIFFGICLILLLFTCCILIFASNDLYGQDLSNEDSENTTTTINQHYQTPPPTKLYDKNTQSLLNPRSKFLIGAKAEAGMVFASNSSAIGSTTMGAVLIDYVIKSSFFLGFTAGAEFNSGVIVYPRARLTIPYSFGLSPGILFNLSDKHFLRIILSMGSTYAYYHHQRSYKPSNSPDLSSGPYVKLQGQINFAVTNHFNLFTGVSYGYSQYQIQDLATTYNTQTQTNQESLADHTLKLSVLALMIGGYFKL